MKGQFDNKQTACEILETQTGIGTNTLRAWVDTFNIDIVNDACYLSKNPLDVVQDVLNNELKAVIPHLKYTKQ